MEISGPIDSRLAEAKLLLRAGGFKAKSKRALLTASSKESPPSENVNADLVSLFHQHATQKFRDLRRATIADAPRAYIDVTGIAHAQSMAAHESPRTTKLYDRTKERLTQNEVERIRF